MKPSTQSTTSCAHEESGSLGEPLLEQDRAKMPAIRDISSDRASMVGRANVLDALQDAIDAVLDPEGVWGVRAVDAWPRKPGRGSPPPMSGRSGPLSQSGRAMDAGASLGLGSGLGSGSGGHEAFQQASDDEIGARRRFVEMAKFRELRRIDREGDVFCDPSVDRATLDDRIPQERALCDGAATRGEGRDALTSLRLTDHSIQEFPSTYEFTEPCDPDAPNAPNVPNGPDAPEEPVWHVEPRSPPDDAPAPSQAPSQAPLQATLQPDEYREDRPLRSIACRARKSASGGRIPTGIEAVDAMFGGGLPWRGLHEWLGVDEVGEEATQASIAGSGRPSVSPLGALRLLPIGVLVALAWRALKAFVGMRGDDGRAGGVPRVLWIGRDVWPNPGCLLQGERAYGRVAGHGAFHSLWGIAAGDLPCQRERSDVPAGCRRPPERRALADVVKLEAQPQSLSLLAHSVFVAPHGGSVDGAHTIALSSRLTARSTGPPRVQRTSRGLRGVLTSGAWGASGVSGGGIEWAVEQAIRSEGVAVVVADGSGFSMAATRRLHLAMATRSTPQLVLLARPSVDRSLLSSALTRWLVSPSSLSSCPLAKTARTPPWESPGEPLWSIQLASCKASLLAGRRGLLAHAAQPKADVGTQPSSHMDVRRSEGEVRAMGDRSMDANVGMASKEGFRDALHSRHLLSLLVR
jgi:hypothetical protein